MRIILLVLLSVSLVRAEDWTTTDGTVYKSVKVLSHDDGYVTVLDSDGGGKIPLRLLNPELQKKFGYDAAKAKSCEALTAAQDKAEGLAVAKAEEAEDAAKQKQLIAYAQQDAAPAAAQGSSPTAQPSSPAGAAPKLSDDDKKAIQSQIDSLNADITFMQGEENKVTANGYLKTGGDHQYGGGGYADKIKSDQQQIQQLQAQMNGN